MALTDTEIRKSKPLEKDYQKSVGKGLSLVIRSKGTKHGVMNLGLMAKKINPITATIRKYRY